MSLGVTDAQKYQKALGSGVGDSVCRMECTSQDMHVCSVAQ